MVPHPPKHTANAFRTNLGATVLVGGGARHYYSCSRPSRRRTQRGMRSSLPVGSARDTRALLVVLLLRHARSVEGTLRETTNTTRHARHGPHVRMRASGSANQHGQRRRTCSASNEPPSHTPYFCTLPCSFCTFTSSGFTRALWGQQTPPTVSNSEAIHGPPVAHRTVTWPPRRTAFAANRSCTRASIDFCKRVASFLNNVFPPDSTMFCTSTQTGRLVSVAASK